MYACIHVCLMLLNNQIFELEQHEAEWVEVIFVWQWVARGNIQQINLCFPDRATFALWAHADLSVWGM